MNLTVKALREAEGACEQFKALDIVKNSVEAKAELENLSVGIKGCISMINDLEVCYESLAASGFTDEWFSIMNKDNRLVAVCGINMPKFFGNESTKYEACMEGILDTLRTWVGKVWEFIKKAFEWLGRAVRELRAFWNRRNTDSWVRTHVMPKVINAAAVNNTPEKFMIKAKNMDTLDRYTSNLTRMLEALLQLDVSTMLGNANAAGPEFSKDSVYVQLAEFIQTYGLDPNNKIATGFQFIQGGIEFVPVNEMADKEFLISDAGELAKAEGFLKDIAKHAGRVDAAHAALEKALRPTLERFKKCKKEAEDEILNSKNNAPGQADLKLKLYTDALKSATAYSTFLIKCQAQFQSISAEIDRYVRSRDAAIAAANAASK